MAFRRTFLVLVLVFILVGLFYILSPWVAAFVRHERLNRYIKIRTDYPGCVPGKQAPESLKCQCEFIFEHVEVPAALTFEGTGLSESYDPTSRTYNVSGIGTIRSASNRVVLYSERIVINGTELPPDQSSSWYVLIQSDGKLTNSRVDISW